MRGNRYSAASRLNQQQKSRAAEYSFTEFRPTALVCMDRVCLMA